MQLSAATLTACQPSSFSRTPLTSRSCPSSCSHTEPLRVSQHRTTLSVPPVASSWPLGVMSSAYSEWHCSPVWPGSERHSVGVG